MNIIYAIQHKDTKRIYIGCTGNTSRIKKHLGALRAGSHKNELMQKDYNTYGENYSIHILDIVKDRDRTFREKYWMHYFNTYDPDVGYNYKDRMARKIPLSEFPVYNEERMRVIGGTQLPWDA